GASTTSGPSSGRRKGSPDQASARRASALRASASPDSLGECVIVSANACGDACGAASSKDALAGQAPSRKRPPTIADPSAFRSLLLLSGFRPAFLVVEPVSAHDLQRIQLQRDDLVLDHGPRPLELEGRVRVDVDRPAVVARLDPVLLEILRELVGLGEPQAPEQAARPMLAELDPQPPVVARHGRQTTL